MTSPFAEYIKKIEADFRRGIATEHTYRGTLELLIESYGRGIDASNDPKHLACGAPDFIVEKGKVPLGYVETKDIGVDLNHTEKNEQMRRYLKALNNLILTDYLEFRWYVNGEKKRTVRVAEPTSNGRLALVDNADQNIEALFKDFYAIEAPTVTSPKDLAYRLAAVTHFIRDQIIQALKSGDPAVQAGLEKRLKTFRELLLPAISAEEFADLYAQAMAYGLFAAKLSAPETEKFTLASAYSYLGSNKFLRNLFSDVAEELDEIDIIRPYLLDIVSLLNRADFGSILADFGRRTRTEDPVVHFYETFLAAYDPKMRESRGVYYTPEPVVQFIVRAVDDLLKTRFNKPWGLADSSVKVLDPATGTGTFLYYVIQQIHDEVVVKRQQGGQWASVSKELLNRLFGFELLIAPYVVAHLKLGLKLKDLGAPIAARGERLQVYLTNTLEEGISRAEQLAGLGHYIAEESSDAAKVKKRDDIMVVLGNPPYSGHSANPSVGPDGKPNFIGKLLRDYYFVDGAPLGERNPKWLQDDYVKFIRFGEWRINQTGHGILAFITNHGYLDNPTFRGMRQHLMKTFDEIFVIDLHGNSKNKEIAPDGRKDENVFDIQQGVAILICVKNKGTSKINKSKQAISHSEIWGTREEKYRSLMANNIIEFETQTVEPATPYYLFKPTLINSRDEFNSYWPITKVYTRNNLGMNSHRDDFAISFEKNDLVRKLLDFRSLELNDELIRQRYSLNDNRDWKLDLARANFRKDNNWENKIIMSLYRPFDFRWLIYSPDLLDYPRPLINDQMLLGENYSFATTRQTRENFSILATNLICSQHKIATPYDGSYIFPLYHFTPSTELFSTQTANISKEYINTQSSLFGLSFTTQGIGDGQTSFGPEDVFNYTYAVFHSPTYRTRYAEFLKIDFPRLPLTSDRKLFFALAAKGKELVGLHLLKSPRVNDFITSYPVAGSNRVEKVTFGADPESAPGIGRVYINAQQYFGGVPADVWNFKIGGYQVCDKWLKDRKGRELSGEDISHYQRVVVSLQETIRLMQEIDEVIPGWPIE